jgi:nucleoid-associated protein YgaU
MVDRPLVPSAVSTGAAAAVLGASALVAATEGAAPAQAVSAARVQAVDEAPTVSPKELDKQLADPNEPTAKAAPRPAQAPGGSRVVRPGDSLWGIANAELGGNASNAQIAQEVNRLWTINSAAIGTGNPDLILPGQRLKLR